MILLPVLMVLISAALHGYWNLLVKKASNKVLFSYLYVTGAILTYTPLFVYLLPRARIPWQGWLCILGTGSVYCLYFLLLARSYSYGDLSHVYPIARGLAPVLTLVWAFLLLGERPSAVGWSGILMVIISIALFHPPRGGGFSLSGSLGRLREPASLAAVGTGFCISAYLVIDKVGVSFVDPMIYIYLTFAVCEILLSPYFFKRFGWSAIQREITSAWRQALSVGFLSIFSYLLVLLAMRLADVSYIISVRSTSILFAVLFGLGVLGERRTALKISASIMMMLGVALIALS